MRKNKRFDQGGKRNAKCEVRKVNRVVIDCEKCKECGYCLHFCPQKVVLKKGTDINKKGYCFIVVDQPEQCIACGICATVCPEIAISVEKDI